MAEKSELYSFKLKDRFWFDIGKPGDYIVGQKAFLDYYKIAKYAHLKPENNQSSKDLPSGCECKGSYLIDPSA